MGGKKANFITKVIPRTFKFKVTLGQIFTLIYISEDSRLAWIPITEDPDISIHNLNKYSFRTKNQTFFTPCTFEFMSHRLFIVQHSRLERSQVAAENPNAAFPKQELWFPVLLSHTHTPPHRAAGIQIFPLMSCREVPTLPHGAAQEKPWRSWTPFPDPAAPSTPQGSPAELLAWPELPFSSCLRPSWYLEAKLLPKLCFHLPG